MLQSHMLKYQLTFKKMKIYIPEIPQMQKYLEKNLHEIPVCSGVDVALDGHNFMHLNLLLTRKKKFFCSNFLKKAFICIFKSITLFI